MTEQEEILITFLEEQGYENLCIVPDRGVCGTRPMIFTTGLFYNMNEQTYEGRYCFQRSMDAEYALVNWDGVGDPPGNWIKHKGKIEYSNPNFEPSNI